MAEFDLDANVESVGGGAAPAITSKFLCTPGCVTGFLNCGNRPITSDCRGPF